MHRKVKILEICNELGLGGTEYTLQLFSKYLDKEVFDVEVLAIKSGGERVQLLEELGIKVIVLNNDLSSLPECLQNIDVVHWHGSGSIQENYKFFEILKNNKPKLVIQTNIFGLYDNHPWYNELIDYDLYVSKMVIVRRMNEDKYLHERFINKRKVLTNPVDVALINSLRPNYKVVSDLKDKLALTGCFIVGRLGRASDAKFDYITIDAFNEFLKLNNKGKLLMNGVTPKMRAYIKKLGILDRFVELPNTPDLKQLILYYSTMDVFLACSTIGESFGMVMAESMAVGTPVVTVNTPDRDNAQIEVVDNNLNGFVTYRTKRSMAESLYKLSCDSALLEKFSKEAEKKISHFYEAKKTVKSLENLILTHFSEKKVFQTDSLIINWSDELIKDYDCRLKNIDGNYNLLDKFVVMLERNRGYKKYKRVKQRLVERLF